jgi:hypothetical protein
MRGTVGPCLALSRQPAVPSGRQPAGRGAASAQRTRAPRQTVPRGNGAASRQDGRAVLRAGHRENGGRAVAGCRVTVSMEPAEDFFEGEAAEHHNAKPAVIVAHPAVRGTSAPWTSPITADARTLAAASKAAVIRTTFAEYDPLRVNRGLTRR